jgi:hypothetical protein
MTSTVVQAPIAKARVRRINGAYALLTDRPIATDEIVFVLEGEITEHPSKWSVQIGERKHLEPLSHDPNDVRSLIHFFNHSCDPSTCVNFEDLTVRALRDLEPGEEVTFNYNTTEYEMANPFNCHCNSKNCFGYVSGFKYLSSNRQLELISQLAPYLRVTI